MAIKIISPSSYGEGKIYGISPSTPSINTDTTFTRASTKTRINNEGLVESVPYNLLINSEDINIWNYNEISVTTNAAISPNGYQNADKIIPNTVNTNHYAFQNINVVSGRTYTYSFFAKADGYNFTGTFISGLGLGPTWDLQNGIASAGAFIIGYGNGWYRCIVSGTATTTGTASIRIYALNSSLLSTFAGNGTDGILIWGAQLVEGSALQPYIRTTDRLNVPSIDYSLGTTNKPVLLLEPQRTNSLKKQRAGTHTNAYPSH